MQCPYLWEMGGYGVGGDMICAVADNMAFKPRGRTGAEALSLSFREFLEHFMLSPVGQQEKCPFPAPSPDKIWHRRDGWGGCVSSESQMGESINEVCQLVRVRHRPF